MKATASVNRKRLQRGFTLLELILVVAIFAIVAVLIGSISLFGLKTYQLGDNDREIQYDARTTSDFITRELRTATLVSLTAPANLTGYYMIYYEDHYIKTKLASSGAAGTIKSKNYYASATDLSFHIYILNGKYMLGFDLTATKGQASFDLASDVLMNNIQNAVVDGTTSNTVYYKKP